MPNVTLHLVLANRLLDDPELGPSWPFDPLLPRNRNAFEQGSLGPDLGYFPGGEPFFSDLAHYIRSGELTRRLVDRADRPEERAFAWGWASHVLLDQAVHPIVGQAVGEFLTGRRTFVSAAADKTHHVRLEVGLDAAYSHRHPELRVRPLAPALDGSSIGYLSGAYEATYGVPFDRGTLLASHYTTVRMAQRALASIGAMAPLVQGPDRPTLRAVRATLDRGRRVVETARRGESMLMAFLTPVPPRAWFVQSVDEALESVHDRFRSLLDGGLDGLPDYNLDTGQSAWAVDSHPCAAGAHRRLERLRGRGPAPRIGTRVAAVG